MSETIINISITKCEEIVKGVKIRNYYLIHIPPNTTIKISENARIKNIFTELEDRILENELSLKGKWEIE